MSGLPSRAWRLGDLDWTRGHGIPFDRTLCPADDEMTDLAAWLAGRFDSLAADEFDPDKRNHNGRQRQPVRCNGDQEVLRPGHEISRFSARVQGSDGGRQGGTRQRDPRWLADLLIPAFGGFDTRLNAAGTARAASTVELGERSQPTKDATGGEK